MNHHVIAPPMSQVARAPRCRRGRSARWACAALLAACLLPATYASEVLKAAGVSGGLCVHLGCGDGTLVTAIAGEARFIVHGLEADAAAVERTRKVLSQRRLFGQASVEQWDAKTLPYADNVVNLLITDLPTAVPQPEIMRVLAPGGVWCRREGVTWQRTVKPKPAGMDEWPQWRHGADRNPVSQDDLVDVPQRTQWLSFQGNQGKDMLTNGGRNYTLVGGLLRVRDAFNGLPLWNAKVDGKCRAVALVDGVLVVDKGKLVRLDGGTGRLVRTYDEAGTPNVILHVPQPQDPDGVLVVADGGAVTALAGATGKTLWRATHQFPRGLSIGAGLVYLISGDPRTSGTSTAMALDLMTGKARWERSDLPWSKTCYRTAFGNGTLAFECGRFAIPPGMDEDKAAVTAIYFLQAADGKTIRDYKYMPAMRHDETPRAFFLDSGRLAMHQGETKDRPTALALFDDLTRSPTLVPTAYARRFPLYCHPPVATERFFIYGEMGFTDWKTFKHRSNPITRGSCGRESEGLVPANGLVYVFPKSCSCFSMLNGVAALAPPYDRTIEEAHPLVKGPAFGVAPAAAATKDEWATYRGDVHRSGSVARTVPPKLQPLWTATPEQPAFTGPAQEEWKEYPFATGPLTPPVIAQGLVVVAQPHTHRVLAFKAEDGKPAWEFTANGRIDSAPTISDGLCLFGSRTGWVYCLKASDGQLVWRLRIAPADLRIVHCGQVESPWPVAGSVLVSDGVAYVSAGVHPLTDGGMRVCAVDPRTGSITWKQIVTDMGYNDHAWRGRMGLDQDYADLMVKDGERVALSRWVFDPATGKNEYLFQNSFYRLGRDGGYLTRGAWSYGYPMNRPRVRRPLQVGNGLMVFGTNKGADPSRFKWEPTGGAPQRQALKLFRRDFKPGEQFDVKWVEQKNDTESRIGLYFPANRTAENSTWSAAYPGWPEAMVLAGANLFVYAEGKLKSYAAADGAPLNEMALAQPVWDGIAASGGRLYLSTMDGKVVCLGE
jgi:outer membrane protein assembly factor BamB